MRNIFSILFLLVYLVANTELHQFIQMPVFFEHYQEHRLSSPGISLTDFVILHYFSGDQQDADYAHDQQLPFKNTDCPELTISIALPPEEIPESKIQVFSLSRNEIMYESIFNLSSFHYSIWQPPRI